MAKIISIHSFRGGTGKSNTTANLAAILASMGKRVGVVDTDIQSPGIHILFGVPGDTVTHSLNDYLWGNCAIVDAATDVTSHLGPDLKGKVFLIPSSIKAGEIARVLREGYDAKTLTNGFRSFIDELKLDFLLIDTHPGLSEETLLSIVISNTLLLIMRPDQQDYEGTGVTVQVARKLGVPNMMILLNKVPAAFDQGVVKAQVEAAYNCPVVAVLPHSDEMMALASGGVFVLRFPDHPIAAIFKNVAGALIG